MNHIKVELIDYTGKSSLTPKEYAADILLFTKSTRLNMDTDLLSKIKSMTYEEKLEQLKYMSNTIPSSWEFIDVTFLVSNLTRAIAQQVTRNRYASYAMQSQRVVDMASAKISNPYPLNSDHWGVFEIGAEESFNTYNRLVATGSSLQDARGILPVNCSSNIVCKYNFRSFVDMVLARKSLRVQDEHAKIVSEMHRLVIEAWPWSSVFFESKFDKAIDILESVAKDLEITTGKGAAWEIAKAIDLLRKA